MFVGVCMLLLGGGYGGIASLLCTFVRVRLSSCVVASSVFELLNTRFCMRSDCM